MSEVLQDCLHEQRVGFGVRGVRAWVRHLSFGACLGFRFIGFGVKCSGLRRIIDSQCYSPYYRAYTGYVSLTVRGLINS